MKTAKLILASIAILLTACLAFLLHGINAGTRDLRTDVRELLEARNLTLAWRADRNHAIQETRDFLAMTQKHDRASEATFYKMLQTISEQGDELAKQDAIIADYRARDAREKDIANSARVTRGHYVPTYRPPVEPSPAPPPESSGVPSPTSHYVEYEVHGQPIVAHATYEAQGGMKQEDIMPNMGWRYSWTAKSGDFVSLSIQLDRYPGETTVVLRVDGKEVKRNSVIAPYSICDVSLGLE